MEVVKTVKSLEYYVARCILWAIINVFVSRKGFCCASFFFRVEAYV